MTYSILIVDDEEPNQILLESILDDAGEYQIDIASDGVEAWELLQQHPNKYSVILLDRMMPGMNGMQVLEKIKSHEILNPIPVIMQTAMAKPEDALEGLMAGAHYYVTKPYDSEQALQAIVKTAAEDFERYTTLRAEVLDLTHALQLTQSWELHFRTLQQTYDLAKLLAKACPDPEEVVVGFAELLMNAVEHGNLGVTYEEKSALNLENAWEAEVERRLSMAEYKDKKAIVNYQRKDNEIRVVIKDEGSGFDWKEYMQLSPQRVTHTHGRGIASSKKHFTRLEYLGIGNEVMIVIELS